MLLYKILEEKENPTLKQAVSIALPWFSTPAVYFIDVN